MPESNAASWNRREVLQVGATAAATVAGSTLLPGASLADDKPTANTNKPVLPRRVLGKTGVSVTMLNQGTVGNPTSLDRLVRYAYREGVRYFDTAASYGSEGVFAAWFDAAPEIRKSIFLATKSEVRAPEEMLGKVDERLKALRTDHIDLLFFHGLNSDQTEWPRSKVFQKAIEAIKKTGKASFVGFSTHDERIAEQIQNAAEGGFVDVIMLKFDPWLAKESPLNKALDACHARNIGLVSMKQLGGQALQVTQDRVPTLKARGLTPAQGLLHAIWSDERFSSSCVTLRNVEQTMENADAARRFEPLKQAELDELRNAVLAAGPTMCPNCDGRCALAAGTKARLGDLARFYTYHEDHGIRSHARNEYAKLSTEHRDWQGADLQAARAACHNKINFSQLLPEVDRLLG